MPEKALKALTAGALSDPLRDQHVARCCRHIVRRPRDLGLATQSLDDTAVLFANMVDAAVERAERRHVPVVESGLPSGLGQVALTG